MPGKYEKGVVFNIQKRGYEGNIMYKTFIVASNGRTTYSGARVLGAATAEATLKELIEDIQAGRFKIIQTDNSHAARQKRNPNRPAGRARISLEK